MRCWQRGGDAVDQRYSHAGCTVPPARSARGADGAGGNCVSDAGQNSACSAAGKAAINPKRSSRITNDVMATVARGIRPMPEATTIR